MCNDPAMTRAPHPHRHLCTIAMARIPRRRRPNIRVVVAGFVMVVPIQGCEMGIWAWRRRR